MKRRTLLPAKPSLKRKAGRPKKIFDKRNLHSIVEVMPDSSIEALEGLLIFDARCLDNDTRQGLIRILPQLVHIRRAWKAEFVECGCVCCHKKIAEYGFGGFCNACGRRLGARMRNRFRKLMSGRDLKQELVAFKDALALRFNAAQRLFNGED